MTDGYLIDELVDIEEFEKLLTSNKSIIVTTKGGPGSGHKGHRGRPGIHGGSLPDGAAGTGLREGWEKYRDKIYAKMERLPEGRGLGIGTHPDKTASVIKGRKEVIAILDDLSQAELTDMILNRVKNGKGLGSHWDSPQGALLISRLDEEHAIQVENELFPLLDNYDGTYFHMTEEGRALMYPEWGEASSLLNRLNDEVRAENLANGSEKSLDVLDEMIKYGPTDDFRQKLHKRLEEYGAFRSASHLDAMGEYVPSKSTELEDSYEPWSFGDDPENLAYGKYIEVGDRGKIHLAWDDYPTLSVGGMEGDMKRVSEWWTRDSSFAEFAFVGAYASKAFGNMDDIECYWNTNSLGIIFKDPNPSLVKVVKEMYNRTQTYYANPSRKVPENLYRGVLSKVTVRSPLESFSGMSNVADMFRSADNWENVGFTLTERNVNRKRIFASYMSMKGYWPPEKDLKGKREFVLLPEEWIQ